MTSPFAPDVPPLLRQAWLWTVACFACEETFREARALLDLPRSGSIITLSEPIQDENGDELPVGLDVVALECHEDGSILVSADQEDETEVSAWVHPGEWHQREGER